MVHSLILKVCGITREEDALLAEESGASILGVVRARDSPRFAEAGFVDRLVGWGYNVAGVYNDRKYLKDNYSEEEIIQIHYPHEPEEITLIRKMTGKQIISVVQAQKALNPGFNLVPYLESADLVLLENKPRMIGHIPKILLRSEKLGVAGGIEVKDIGTIIEKGIHFIDLSSSLEDSPGRKNEKKMKMLKEVIGTIAATI
ncbi:MAG: phosphoribosylanthranilate isomerase [Thermoplasmataceae archaeon]